MPLNVLCEYCYSGLTMVIERFVEVGAGQSHQNSDGVSDLPFFPLPACPSLSFMPQILTLSTQYG